MGLAVGSAVRGGITLARGLAKQAGIRDPGLRFIDKYAPPHLRKPLRKYYKIGTGLVAGKSIYDVYDDITNQNGSLPQKPSPGRFNEKRHRRFRNTSRRYKYDYCYPRRKRRSAYSSSHEFRGTR